MAFFYPLNTNEHKPSRKLTMDKKEFEEIAKTEAKNILQIVWEYIKNRLLAFLSK